MNILMIIFFLSHLFFTELKCNFSLQYIYLVQYYAAMYFDHSSVQKAHLFGGGGGGHVVFVYWKDTVYVQNHLSTELRKMTTSRILKKSMLEYVVIIHD